MNEKCAYREKVFVVVEYGTLRDRHSAFIWSKFLLILGIILLAANLRAAITGVGPLVSMISTEAGLSNTLAGMLTTLPLIAFTVFSPLAPKVARRFGIEYTLLASLVCLTVGILVRCTNGTAGLFIGMFLVGAAIAMGNVLLPSLIKRDFPHRIGLMTGVYTIAMSGCAGVASGISVPVSRMSGLGWRGSLASWSVLSILGLVVWLPQLRRRQLVSKLNVTNPWKSGLAWQVTLFMGLQSFAFYVNVAWLPELLQGRGMSVTAAGWMLSIMQFVSLPASFIVPVLAGRRENQRSLVVFTTTLFLMGYGGLLVSGTLLTWLWITLIGVAGGASISLALTFFGLRSNTAAQAAQLSGMAQSIGYLIAAMGPVLIGYLHDVTHTWTVPLIVLLANILLMLMVGLGAGRNRHLQVDYQVTCG